MEKRQKKWFGATGNGAKTLITQGMFLIWLKTQTWYQALCQLPFILARLPVSSFCWDQSHVHPVKPQGLSIPIWTTTWDTYDTRPNGMSGWVSGKYEPRGTKHTTDKGMIFKYYKQKCQWSQREGCTVDGVQNARKQNGNKMLGVFLPTCKTGDGLGIHLPTWKTLDGVIGVRNPLPTWTTVDGVQGVMNPSPHLILRASVSFPALHFSGFSLLESEIFKD